MSVKLLNIPNQTTAQATFQDILPTGSQAHSKQNTASNIQLPGLSQKSSGDAAAPQKALNCCDILDWLRRKIGPKPLPFPLPNPRLPLPKQPTPSPRDPREPGFPKGGPIPMPRPLPPLHDGPRIGFPIQPPPQRPAPYLRPINPINNGFKLPTVPPGGLEPKGLFVPGQLNRLIQEGRAHSFEPNIDLAWVPGQDPQDMGRVTVPYSDDSRVHSIQLVSSDGSVLATAEMPSLSAQLKTPGQVTVDFGLPLQSFPPNVKLVVTYRPIDENRFSTSTYPIQAKCFTTSAVKSPQ
jgi:hypothetical protein